jgi:hypothetical protein
MRPVRLVVSVAAIALALVVLAPIATAADSHPCAAKAEPSERLACYDKAFPPGPGARYGDVGMTEADREAQRQQALRDFGLNDAQKEERQPDAERDLRPERIEAGVTKVSYRATGERVIALDNGQVWLITEVTEKGWIKAGDRIAVKKALLGTFMLDTGRVQLRARRIQ